MPSRFRGGISGLVASIVLVAIAAQAVYAIITLYGRSYGALSRAYADAVKDINAQAANVRVKVVGGEVRATSSTPLRIIGSYLISNDGMLIKFKPPASILTPNQKPLLNSTLTSAIRAGKYRALIIFSGGKYLLIDPSIFKQRSETLGNVRLTGDVVREFFAPDSTPINFTKPTRGFYAVTFTYFAKGIARWTISDDGPIVVRGGVVNDSFFNISGAPPEPYSAIFIGEVIYYDNVRYINLTLTMSFRMIGRIPFSPAKALALGIPGRLAYLVFPQSCSPTKPFNVRETVFIIHYYDYVNGYTSYFRMTTQVPVLQKVVKMYNTSTSLVSGRTVVLRDKIPVYINLTDAPPQGYILIGFEGYVVLWFDYSQKIVINSYG